MKLGKRISEEEVLSRIQFPTSMCECDEPLVDGAISRSCCCGGEIPEDKWQEILEWMRVHKMVEDIISGRRELGDEFSADDSRVVYSRATEEEVKKVWQMVSIRLQAKEQDQ